MRYLPPGLGRGLVASLALLAAAAAHADDLQIEVMAGGCANCHGTDGRLSGAVPPLAGRDQALLESRLLAFKHEEVPGTTIMDRIAKGFSDEELAALAEHYATLAND
ncbi:c-type cytochrome [Halomonas salifodinae]|uniref:c-type cytochrome n=1 Tax=Halomonas salifodinae TaxID=438745 RepID=UPI0033B1099B